MREARFVGRGRPRWERLERLITRIDRSGIGRLAGDEIDALAFDYRGTTSDLAVARAREYDPRLIAYLNALVARAHAYVYLGSTAPGWSRAIRFFSVTFAHEVRRSWRPIALVALLTVATAAIGYRLTLTDPANAYAFVPANAVPLVDRSLHDSNFGFDRAFAPAMSAVIITNNIRVSVVAFAGGITAGIITLIVIGMNGLDVGTTAALFARRGFGYDFWATIAPHGAIEITAIVISGGAGLLIAAGILHPGRLRRIDALTANARRAATLILGVAAMLVIAGLFEGFVSPQRLSPEVRLAVGGANALALALYFGFAGRGAKGYEPKV